MQEDTKQKDENKGLIEEMIHRAEETTMRPPEVVSEGGEDIGPSVLSKLETAGHVYIYDTKTGERSECNRNMLPVKLRLTRGGSTVWTTVKPKITPRRGTFKCLLHPSDPNRAHYDELGFAVCPKETLNSVFQVTRHMQKRHKMEWAAIEYERTGKERQEDRALQQLLIKSQLPKEEAPLYVSKKDREKA